MILYADSMPREQRLEYPGGADDTAGMRLTLLVFWALLAGAFAGAFAIALSTFLAYRKTLRHLFSLVSCAALVFAALLVMVWETTIEVKVAAMRALEEGLLSMAIALAAWDLAAFLPYRLNKALGARFRKGMDGAAVALCALVPVAAGVALLTGRIVEAMDACQAGVSFLSLGFLVIAVVVAVKALREPGPAGRKAALVFFIALAAFLPVLGAASRWFIFAKEYPQRELSLPLAFLVLDLLATALSAAFGPGEVLEGFPMAVPIAFIREAGITAREEEALELLARGSSYKDIAVKLGVSLPAVKKRLSSVYRKSGAANRVELLNILLSYGDAEK